MRKLRAIALACLPVVAAAQGIAPAPAAIKPPVLTLNALGRASAPLDGPWQFHLGDDPSFASPNLDDSSWQAIHVGQNWEVQGHPGYTGFAWYRIHLVLPADPAAGWQLALFLPAVEDACDVYWNGLRVGGYGRTPPHPVWYWNPIPTALQLGPPQSGVLAIRVWKAPYTFLNFGYQGGLVAVPHIGSADAVAGLQRVALDEQASGNEFPLLLMLVSGVVGVLALLAFLRNRSQTMLLWLALATLGAVFRWPLEVPGFWSSRADYGLAAPIILLEDIAIWFLLLALLGLTQNRRLVRWTAIVAMAAMSFALLHAALQLFPWSTDPGHRLLIADITVTTPEALLELWGLVLVGFALRKRLDPARWVLALAVLITEVLQALDDFAGFSFRWTRLLPHFSIDAPLFAFAGFSFSLYSLGNAVLLAAILYAAWRYLTEQNHRQNVLEQEFTQAREVQQILVPEALPALNGFRVDSVYRPFGEVGGDFFQILALDHGAALAVIGDVSGKGMPAAMTVALLVGTLRTLAQYTQSPSAILAALNQRVIGRSSGGFTTCLVLRAAADGTLILASAGHLPPWRNGEELALDAGVPLGLVPDAHYAETKLQLSPGDQLTLLSDGVVEARNPAGELFGFERTAAISTQSAEEIARAAQQFGQEDDITVLTLTFAPQEVAHA